MSSNGLLGHQAYTWYTDMHTDKTPIHIHTKIDPFGLKRHMLKVVDFNLKTK